jgi:hypothetical protein
MVHPLSTQMTPSFPISELVMNANLALTFNISSIYKPFPKTIKFDGQYYNQIDLELTICEMLQETEKDGRLSPLGDVNL